jgi:glycosyltransferase involved in cell wall biosynthesis
MGRGNSPPLKMKILHGTFETAHQIEGMTKALRDKGLYAKSLCYNPSYLGFKYDYAYNPSYCKDNDEAIKDTSDLSEFFIDRFDIFHFHFGHTMAADYSDLKKIKDAGKKVFMHFWGSDVRRKSVSEKINKYIKIKPQFEDEERAIKLMEWISPYVDVALPGSWELYDHVKDYFKKVEIVAPVLDIAQYQWMAKPNEKLVIVHAPTDPHFKGTRVIEKTLAELKADYDFEYMRVLGMSHEQAKEVYLKADIIIDELHCGDYGLLSCEGMAMGKLVMTWVCDEVLKNRDPDLPIISVNPNTLKERIIWALKQNSEVTELRNRGREYVRKYHGMGVISNQLIKLYEDT